MYQVVSQSFNLQMSSISGEEHDMSSVRQPRSIGQLAQIEVEKPVRKMTLMFGERQVVFIRSDGLRSRVVRENLKKSEKELEEEKKKQDQEKRRAETVDHVVEAVARGYNDQYSTSSSELIFPTRVSSSSKKAESSTGTSSEVNSSPTSNSITYSSSVKLNRKRPNSSKKEGNRSYHPPRRFNGESTMVPHSQRWTYQTACNINAAEQSDESQMNYIPDPFLPMPRGRRSEICTADRMNYAAQRLDNRKFRGQLQAGNDIVRSTNEHISCEKCEMRYFFESKQMQERISYLPPFNEEDLPIVLFDCPVCKVQTKVFS